MSVAVLRGDARHLPLPDASVDLIVTSPPYFGLRSYTDGGVHYAGQIGSEGTPAEWVEARAACTAGGMRVLILERQRRQFQPHRTRSAPWHRRRAEVRPVETAAAAGQGNGAEVSAWLAVALRIGLHRPARPYPPRRNHLGQTQRPPRKRAGSGTPRPRTDIPLHATAPLLQRRRRNPRTSHHFGLWRQGIRETAGVGVVYPLPAAHSPPR